MVIKIKFKLLDLQNIKDFNVNSKLNDAKVSDLLNDLSCEYLSVIVKQEQIECLVGILQESIYNIRKVSVWVNCSPTSSDLFYASRMNKNCCSFVFWLSLNGIKYPKDFPLNIYIEKQVDNIIPDWISSSVEILLNNKIDCEVIGNLSSKDLDNKRRELF